MAGLLWDVTDFIPRCSLAVYPEYMQPAISALRSREGGRNLRPLGSLSILPALLLDSDDTVFTTS